MYHYTKLNNFLKIFEDDTFLLSSFDNANDSKEKVRRVFENGEQICDFKYLSACDWNGLDNGLPLLSFSNSMLWYFYAENHKGVCIEFDKLKLKDLPVKPVIEGKVQYKRGVTRIDEQSIKDYILEKRPCWIGENEYRMVFKNVERIPNICSYISAVYFGANVCVEKICCSIPEGICKYRMYYDSNDGRLNRMKL